MSVTVNGRTYDVGFEPCGCQGSIQEIEREQQLEQAEALRRRDSALRGRLEASGIPKRYLDAEHPKAGDLARSVSDGKSFYIHGKQGTGKTHLAMATGRKLVYQLTDVRAVIVPHLLESIRTRRAEDRELTAKLSECEVLILDEIEKVSPTPYACERLFDIINDRYNSMLPVIVTSNLPLSAIAKRLSEGDVGRSIASRLAEMCRQIRMDGEDRRLS